MDNKNYITLWINLLKKYLFIQLTFILFQHKVPQIIDSWAIRAAVQHAISILTTADNLRHKFLRRWLEKESDYCIIMVYIMRLDNDKDYWIRLYTKALLFFIIWIS